MIANSPLKSNRLGLRLPAWTVAIAALSTGLSTGPSASGAPDDAPTSPTIAVGSYFPDLLLPSLADGTPTSVKKYRGKKVLLHIFASW